jgi:hypothetical protein
MKRFLFAIVLLGTLVPAYSYDEFVIDEPYSGLESTSTSEETSGDGRIPAIGSIPTPESFGRGEFAAQFNFYDGGGFQARFLVGIFDIFSLGVSENIDGLIGSSNVRLGIPGAYLKLSLFPQTEGFNAALGLDNFAFGRHGTYVSTNGDASTVYGVYASFGKSYTVFRTKNMFAFGLRFPLLPAAPENSTKHFVLHRGDAGNAGIRFLFTLENLYLDFTRPEEILPSLIFTLSPFRVSRADRRAIRIRHRDVEPRPYA